MFGIVVGILSFGVIVFYFLRQFGFLGNHKTDSCGGASCSGCEAQSDCSKRTTTVNDKTNLYQIGPPISKALLLLTGTLCLLIGCSEPLAEPPTPTEPPKPSLVSHLTDDDFLIKTRNGVVLLDAYSSGCPPCRMMEPHIEKVAEILKDKVLVAKINAETNREFSRYFGIQAFPTLFVFVDGKLKRTALGYKDEEQLLHFVKEFVPETSPTPESEKTVEL